MVYLFKTEMLEEPERKTVHRLAASPPFSTFLPDIDENTSSIFF
jgi:hypothetical protein